MGRKQVEHDLQSLDVFYVSGRGTVFAIESPIESPRNCKDYLEILGDEVVIDGKAYKPIGLECNLPNTPISKGEKIGLLVEEV